jgi:hypothetical protein
MKRSLGLLLLGILSACETTPARVSSPGMVANEPPGPAAPGDPIAAPLIPPAEIAATETGNPPAASCGISPEFRSYEDCIGLAAGLQATYARARQIHYGAGGPNTTDFGQSRVAEDPFSISRCIAPEDSPRGIASEAPYCRCSSASDDLTPVRLGRFGVAMGDASPPIDGCGQLRSGHSELDWACLYQRDEFPGCDPGVADSCASVCTAFRERAVSHYASTFDVQIRRARFVPHPIDPCRPGSCEFIFEIDNQCFASGANSLGCSQPLLARPSYDCSLLDERFLDDADAGSSALQCNAPTPDAGASSNGDAGTNNSSSDGGAAPAPDGGPSASPADASSDASP